MTDEPLSPACAGCGEPGGTCFPDPCKRYLASKAADRPKPTRPKLALNDPRVVAAKASLDASGPNVGKERVRRALYAAMEAAMVSPETTDHRPTTNEAADDRAYIGNLKHQYRAAMNASAGTPAIYWNLFNPTDEQWARHERLVSVAKSELAESDHA